VVSLEDSVALVRRYVEALNAGDTAALDALFADDIVLHQPSGDRRGEAAIRASLQSSPTDRHTDAEERAAPRRRQPGPGS
jgi:ketosteroid isomerase-like protein